MADKYDNFTTRFMFVIEGVRVELGRAQEQGEDGIYPSEVDAIIRGWSTDEEDFQHLREEVWIYLEQHNLG